MGSYLSRNKKKNTDRNQAFFEEADEIMYNRNVSANGRRRSTRNDYGQSYNRRSTMPRVDYYDDDEGYDIDMADVMDEIPHPPRARNHPQHQRSRRAQPMNFENFHPGMSSSGTRNSNLYERDIPRLSPRTKMYDAQNGGRRKYGSDTDLALREDDVRYSNGITKIRRALNYYFTKSKNSSNNNRKDRRQSQEDHYGFADNGYPPQPQMPHNMFNNFMGGPQLMQMPPQQMAPPPQQRRLRRSASFDSRYY